jgi:regulator of protease activity HflC (stomatin/prohibitin superfamily)
MGMSESNFVNLQLGIGATSKCIKSLFLLSIIDSESTVLKRRCNMLGLRRTYVLAENERVFVLRNKQFEKVLGPGKHQLWDLNNDIETEHYKVDSVYFTNKFAKQRVAEHAELASLLHDWTLSDSEVGLFYLNDMLMGIVAPGERVFIWKDAGEARLERIDVNETLQVDNKLLKVIKRRGVNSISSMIKSAGTVVKAPVLDISIEQGETGILMIDGKIDRTLEAGQYGFWRVNQDVQVKVMDRKNITLEVSGQEILTKDRVSIRINLTANIRVIDVIAAASQVADVFDYIYKTMQLALREAVGTRTLDDLLMNKLYINETVGELVVADLKSVGVELIRVGVKDIILPGEMKAILNQVVEAQKAAEANVIKRREETAATRSLHNTAKMMENNPLLLRLKELESLEKVAESVDKINVYGGLNELMKGTVSIT